MEERKSEISRVKVIIFLGLVILLGAGLRLYKIDFQNLWFDEIYTVRPTDPGNSIASIIKYCTNDQPPAFFLYVHYFFKFFGYSDLNGRVASAILGILSIPVLYLLGKELHGKVAGLIAATLTAVSYYNILYSQEVRFYGMAFLFTALSYLFFVRSFKNLASPPSLANLTGYILSTIILLYTHYFGLIIYCIQALTFLLLIVSYRKDDEFMTLKVYYKRDAQFIRRGFISGAIIILALVPWMPVIWGDFLITSNWIQKPSADFLLEYFYRYFGKDMVSTIICLFACGVFFWTLSKRASSEPGAKIILMVVTLWLVLSYFIPYFRSIIGTPVLLDRYTIISLPAWIIIFAIGLDSLKKVALKFSLVAIIAIAAVSNLFFFRKYYTTINKQQIREAALLVRQQNTTNDFMISNYEWHFNHYFRDAPVKIGNFYGNDFSNMDRFWVLILELNTLQKKADLKLIADKDFEVGERYSFHKTEALLMVRKKKNGLAPLASSSLDSQK